MSALIRILKAPWLATIRSWHGYFMLFVLFAAVAVNLSKMLPIHGAAPRLGIAVLMSVAAVAWKMAVNALWLARDAKALCVPGVARDANATPIACTILAIVLPTLVLGPVFGHPLLWFVSLALIAAAVVAFCLLPTVVAMPAALTALSYVLFVHHPPLPGDPAYLDWAVPALAMLAIVATQRWIVLMRATSLPESTWWRPVNVGGRSAQLRRLHGGAYGFGAFGASSSHQSTHREKRGELRNVGPKHPIRSLRVALHRNLTPFDTRVDPAHLWRWRVALAATVLAPPVIALLAERDLGVGPVLAFAPQLLLFAAILLTATSMRARGIDDAWCSPRADLSLPALLPHLDRGERAHRNALSACVAGDLAVKAWCTYSFVLLFAVLRLPAMFYVYLALILATGVAMQFATATGSLCGRRWHATAGYIMYAAVIMAGAVPMTSWGVRVIHVAPPRLQTLGWPAIACALIWIAFCAAFGTLALVNWRRFRARPHPFLTNGSA